MRNCGLVLTGSSETDNYDRVIVARQHNGIFYPGWRICAATYYQVMLFYNYLVLSGSIYYYLFLRLAPLDNAKLVKNGACSRPDVSTVSVTGSTMVLVG